MQKSFYSFVGLFMIISQTFLNFHEASAQEISYFYHKPTDSYLEIQTADRGLLVKRTYDKQWVVFARRKPGLFFDKSGNRIEKWNENKLSYVPVRSKSGRIYTRWTENDFKPNVLNEAFKVNNLMDPEGLWYCKSHDIYLIVVETREGLKARLKDERKWENYIKQPNANIFKSETGNQYVLNERFLDYFHRDSNHRLEFEKISDSFDGY